MLLYLEYLMELQVIVEYNRTPNPVYETVKPIRAISINKNSDMNTIEIDIKLLLTIVVIFSSLFFKLFLSVFIIFSNFLENNSVKNNI